MRKFLSVLLALAMVFSLTVTSFATEDTDAAAEVAATETAAEMAGKTVILHTNDVHGAVEGYAYIAALKADYEAKGAEVILVDVGDYSQGTTYVSVTKGADAVDMMNVAGYDIVSLGNHEFDYGYAQLKENMTKAEFKVLCANIFEEDGTPIFDANYTYTTESGVKIGFFGMDTPESQTKTNPALIKGLTFATGDEFTKVAEEQVAALADADLVICLAHLGIDAESEPYRSTDLAAAVKGIDFIIDGHSHSVMTEGEKGEAIQSTGTAFANIGVIVIDDATKTIESNSLVEITEESAKDETVAAAAKVIVDRVNAAYGEVFAKSEVTLNGAKAPNGNRDGETNNGDIITDAMVWKVMQNKDGLAVDDEYVVAITNGGGIRAAIKPGDVTKKDVNTVLPFGNTIATVYVTGAELLEALEASTYSLPVGGFPQVSGIEFTLHTGKAYDANAETYPGSTYYGPASINRVEITSINGKAFDAEATYAVITNNFCAAGGDTYYAFAAASAQFDTGVPLDEALMEYITEELGGVIGAKYAAPQGRITIFNPFKDVKTSAWYFDQMINLYEAGVINGTSTTTFNPNGTLTWGAALKLLLVNNGSLASEDAVGAEWLANTMAKAVELGLVDAEQDGKADISRLDFCKLAAKLMGLTSETETIFTDCDDASVMALVDAGVINGMTETTFEPDSSLTRAQIAKILFQLNAIED